MKLRSITLRQAKAWVDAHHEHNESPRGWRFGVSVREGGVILGVGIAGRPPARMIDHETVIELTRICTPRVNARRNVCSMLYGALCRAAAALGYDEAITYTRHDEDAASVRASGFTFVCDVPPQEWDRDNRRRGVTREAVWRKKWHRML